MLFPHDTKAKILPLLAREFLHPVVAVIFILALLSAILSTIDSAILSSASVLAQNVMPRFGQSDTLKSNRYAVLFVAACSLALAFVGESAYDMVKDAYELTMVGLFVPLMIGLSSFPKSGRTALASMLIGAGVWLIHFLAGWESFLSPVPWFSSGAWPLSLCATGQGLLAYFVIEPPWQIA